MVRLLVQNGCDVNILDGKGLTAFYYFATILPFWETPSLKILLDHRGINPNARTPQGCTAVHSLVHFVREKEPVKHYYENILLERINVILEGRVGVDIQITKSKRHFNSLPKYHLIPLSSC